MVKQEQRRVMGTEEATAILIQELIKSDNIKIMTDVNDEEGGVLSLLSTMGEHLKIPALKLFVKNFCMFRVSRFRMGRREMVNVASYTGENPEGRKVKSLKDLFTGMR